MKTQKFDWLNIDFCKLHQEDEYDNLRYSGKITADCLSMLEDLVKNKTTKSLLELDTLAEEFFVSHNTTPVFKGYKMFPNSCCISVNHQLVHSIPSDYKLKDGDLVSFDTGCDYKGSLSDSALTCIYGEGKKEDQELVRATRECLYAAIKTVKRENRVGSIGNAIFQTARKKGFKVIEKYTGHGISKVIHDYPTVYNKSEVDEGVRFQKGMVLAIEPLLVPSNSSTETTLAADGWTVLTKTNSAHYEHSILITEKQVEILTHRENENIDAIFSLS